MSLKRHLPYGHGGIGLRKPHADRWFTRTPTGFNAAPSLRAILALSTFAAAAAVAAAGGGGCAVTRAFSSGPSGSLELRNQSDQSLLQPTITAAAYKYTDSNTADLYLTDLPPDRLANLGDNLDGLSGSIIHIHLFLVPSAGDTPIDTTACNASVRVVVLASGDDGASQIGAYAGGGFVLPSHDPGASAISGSILSASLRLSASTGAFADPLTPADLSGSFRVPLNEGLAASLAARMSTLGKALVRVE